MPSGSCRCRPKQRHTAGRLAIEVRIVYPFHPRSGETVVVVDSKRHAGADHFVIRQPDRTLALLPAWMTEPGLVSSYQLVAQVRLPVEKLGDLRALIDALMASCAGDLPRCRGASHAESTTQSEGSVRRSGTAVGASARTTDQADAVAPSSPGRGGQRRVVPEPIGRSGRRGGP
jgi:hypothetical protein